MLLKTILFLSTLFLTNNHFNFYATRNEDAKKVIMAIFAHADDETNIAPLLSHYARQGNKVYLIVATNGNMGVREHAKIQAGDALATIRQEELKCAAHLLKIQPPIFLNFDDGKLASNQTLSELNTSLTKLLQQYKPDILITWGPEGGYGHSDHRMVHAIVTEIFQSGTSKWPTKLYFAGVPTENKVAAINFSTPTIQWLFENWKTVKKEWLSVRIKCEEEDWANARKALRCHESQFTPLEMDEAQQLLKKFSRDTVYLRNFIPEKKIRYQLF